MQKSPINKLFGIELLDMLGLRASHLAPDDQQAILAMVEDHLHNVILETVLVNLSHEQQQQLELTIDQPSILQEKMVQLASEIPGLQQKIQFAVEEELEKIQSARELLSK